MPAVGARLGEAEWVQREGLRPPSPLFPEPEMELCEDAGVGAAR